MYSMKVSLIFFFFKAEMLLNKKLKKAQASQIFKPAGHAPPRTFPEQFQAHRLKLTLDSPFSTQLIKYCDINSCSFFKMISLPVQMAKHWPPLFLLSW